MKVNEPAMVMFCIFDPLTAPACNISGLKSAHVHARKQYICWSCDRSAFNTVHLDGSFRCSRSRGEKSLNDFKFGTFIARFPSDSAGSMAVKCLQGNHLTFVGPQHRGGGGGAGGSSFLRPQYPNVERYLRGKGGGPGGFEKLASVMGKAILMGTWDQGRGGGRVGWGGVGVGVGALL